MRFLVTALFLILGALPAAASDEVGTKALRCWNLSPDDVQLGGTVFLSTTLKAGIPIGTVVTGYVPDDQRGLELAQGAAKALEACAPYEASDGPYSVTMHATTPESAEVSAPAPGSQ